MKFKRNAFTFKKLSELQQDYTLVDMHVHTKFSDSHVSPLSIINKCKKYGFGVAITDHNTIEGVKEIWQLKEDVLVIPGIEITCKEGFHILIYFYKFNDLIEFYEKHVKDNLGKNPWFKTKIDINTLLDATKNYKCLKGAAHPFGVGLTGIIHHIHNNKIDKSVISKLDFLEVVNGTNFRPANNKAIELALKLNKPFTCGSDGHTLYEVGRVLTYSKGNGVASFLNTIKNKENFFVGDKISKFMQVFHHTSTVQKHMKYPGATISTISKAGGLGIKTIVFNKMLKPVFKPVIKPMMKPFSKVEKFRKHLFRKRGEV